MGGVVWLKFGLVELFGGRFMLKKFQGIWDYLSCTCFTMPLCCIQIWEFIVGVWLSNWWWNLVEINHMIIWACTKSFTSNGSRKVALPSQSSNLPPQTNEFFYRKNSIGLCNFFG